MSARTRLAELGEEEYDEETTSPPRGRTSRSFGRWATARVSGEAYQRSLALGFLAMVPMFLAYELALAHAPEFLRSHSEMALFRAFEPLGDGVTAARRGVLLVLLPLSVILCYRRRIALAPSLIRIFLEGLVGAMLLGPALVLGIRLFGGLPEGIAEETVRLSDPDLLLAARIFGGAAYEELLFRVFLYGGIYLLARRVALFFGAAERFAPWFAEVLAISVSAFTFAGAHLASWNGWLGPGGEAFSPPIFTWRVLAGILLAILFRWRGPGVAAWTHGLFNLALLIGAGPEILL